MHPDTKWMIQENLSLSSEEKLFGQLEFWSQVAIKEEKARDMISLDFSKEVVELIKEECDKRGGVIALAEKVRKPKPSWWKKFWKRRGDRK